MSPMDVIWTTRAGVNVWVSLMTVGHLENTKAMIQRNRWQRRYPQYRRICRELEARRYASRGLT